MIRFLNWAAPLLIVATPAMAEQASTDAAAAPAAATPVAVTNAAPVKPKKVCRKFAVTGQRIAKSVCYTADQWAELDRSREDAAKKYINGVQDSSRSANLSGGGTGGLSTGPLFGLGQ